MGGLADLQGLRSHFGSSPNLDSFLDHLVSCDLLGIGWALGWGGGPCTRVALVQTISQTPSLSLADFFSSCLAMVKVMLVLLSMAITMLMVATHHRLLKTLADLLSVAQAILIMTHFFGPNNLRLLLFRKALMAI